MDVGFAVGQELAVFLLHIYFAGVHVDGAGLLFAVRSIGHAV
jgi:hypothetical protein